MIRLLTEYMQGSVKYLKKLLWPNDINLINT